MVSTIIFAASMEVSRFLPAIEPLQSKTRQMLVVIALAASGAGILRSGRVCSLSCSLRLASASTGTAGWSSSASKLNRAGMGFADDFSDAERAGNHFQRGALRRLRSAVASASSSGTGALEQRHPALTISTCCDGAFDGGPMLPLTGCA